jgi:hypothetical protein
MTEFDDLYNKLQDYITELERKFVSNILSTASPESYELDVRAYCILAHAALEEYFEQIALTVMDRSIQNWLQPMPVINDTLLTLLAYSDEKIDYEGSPFQNVKTILEKGRQTLSYEISFHNHGISNKHLSKILLPVSLQISDDVNLQNSLNKLVEQRGTFAHKGRIKNVLSPEDAKKYVSDCLTLCDDIRKKSPSQVWVNLRNLRVLVLIVK